MRGVRAIRVPEDERARLHNAVDHAGVEGEIEDAIGLVDVRQGRGERPREAMARVEKLETELQRKENRKTRSKAEPADLPPPVPVEAKPGGA